MKTLVIVAIFIATAAWAEEKQVPSDEARECVKNFTEAGSFFKGKTYKTWQEYKNIEYDKAFRRVAQTVAEHDWGTVNANKDLGIITASQTVTMGQGSVAPLTVTVKEKSGGLLRIEASFGTAGGQVAAAKTVRTELCRLVEAAAE